MTQSKKDTLFVTCSGGLEPLLSQELTELGFNDIRPGYRGVYVDIDSLDAVYKINYCSRIASRVLLPLYQFKCYDSKALYRGISEIIWGKYIPKGKTFSIDSNVQHKLIRNSLFAAQVTKDANCDQFREQTGSRPSIETKDPDVQLNLFIHREHAIISFDTSGSPLNRRGYRQGTVEAPIRESLAAALLRLAKYRGDELMLDPCCGSGTLLIEAALIATKTPPGYLRTKWGFMYLPDFSQQAWLKVKMEADKDRIPLQPKKFIGLDINKSAVQVAKMNLRAAGFHQNIEVIQRDFREYEPTEVPNFLMSNPPHGKRLDDVDHLKPLYRALGEFMKQHMAKPSRGFIFTGRMDLAKEVGLAPTRRYEVDNAGIDSRLLEFEIY